MLIRAIRIWQGMSKRRRRKKAKRNIRRTIRY